MKKILCVLADGVEETELAAPVDVLRRAEIEVVMASFTGKALVTGKQGMVVQADALIEDVDASTFDALLIPGGPAVMALREEGRVAALAKEFAEADKWVAAICAAPLLVKDAGILDGKRHTSHDSVWGELTDSVADERVVVDGKLITSRGPGTAVDFGLRIIEEILGADQARQIAKDIMV